MNRSGAIVVREVNVADLDALVALENQCFETDRLSRRSFKHWIAADHRAFLIAESGGRLAGYVLSIYHPGTRLGRIYSLAVASDSRGQGIARRLILAAEQAAVEGGRLYLRLEVGIDNNAAIRLYESLGFQRFGIHRDYYEDHKDALRLQKRIRHYAGNALHRPIPWIRQSTHFSCGPASLMMAMQSLDIGYRPTLEEELAIWREATTIFMTSGHGGCHPVGLALAAHRRGFDTEVWINQQGPLFVDGVRQEEKKHIITTVHYDYEREALACGIPIHYCDVTQNDLIAAFQAGATPIILISTYSMIRKKAPHWVVMSGYDDACLYVHDPDPDESRQSALDCQYVPIARGNFERMSCFGKNRLRTALIVKKKVASREFPF
ncbi:MAG: peptidase C39 family protein [Gammaproteobacteria bacterium]